MSEIKTNKISSLTSSNSDITLDPDGTGDVIVESGNVGIGTTPASTSALQVFSGSAGRSVFRHSAGDGGITVTGSGAGSGAAVVLGNTWDNDSGSNFVEEWRINMDGSNDSLQFKYNANANTAMTLDSSGNVLVGPATTTFRTTPGAGSNGADIRADDSNGGRLRLSRSGTDGATMISFINTNGEVGGIDTSGTSTAYNTSSDYRLKENVADMTGAIDRVKALAPKRFNFIADDTVTVDGFLAHEAQAVVPEAVKGTHNEVDDDGNPVMQGIDQSKLVPLLTGALKEAIAKIEALETSNADLTARVTALENA